jgi:hypothetical protein
MFKFLDFLPCYKKINLYIDKVTDLKKNPTVQVSLALRD